jgi:hypothetical protein
MPRPQACATFHTPLSHRHRSVMGLGPYSWIKQAAIVHEIVAGPYTQRNTEVKSVGWETTVVFECKWKGCFVSGSRVPLRFNEDGHQLRM